MCDADMRPALWKLVKAEFDSDSLFVEEMVILNGRARIDLAVVNGALHGFEIKSNLDTLRRLPDQQEAYSGVFDHVNIVVGDKHAKSVQSSVPKWWGVYQARWDHGRTTKLTQIREPKMNEHVDPLMLLRLLRRNEVENILRVRGLGMPVRVLKFYELDAMVASVVALQELKREVRIALKNRDQWRVGTRHT